MPVRWSEEKLTLWATAIEQMRGNAFARRRIAAETMGVVFAYVLPALARDNDALHN